MKAIRLLLMASMSTTLWCGMLEGLLAAGPTSWQRATDYPLPAYGVKPVEYAGRLYVLGGYGITNSYFAAVNPDGTLQPWTETTGLPIAGLPDVAAVSNCLYVSYGSGEVFRAPINSDGSLGSWQALASPGSWHGGRIRAYGGFLYVFGGWVPAGSFYSTVSLAQINPDGSLGPWATTTFMPQGRQHLSVHFFNGRAYIVAGITEGDQLLDSAFSAPVNSDGTLGDWRQEAGLPHRLWQHASVLVNGELLLFGGITEYSGGPMTSVYRGVIDRANGAIENWTVAGWMPSANVVMPGAVYSEAGQNVYLIGGWNLVGGAENSSPEVWRSRLPLSWQWALSWQRTTDYPLPAYGVKPVDYAGRLYVLGGYETTNSYFAAVNRDGTMQPWTETAGLPIAGLPDVAAVSNHLYVSYGNGEVFRAPINSDGSLGSWQALASPGPWHGGRIRAYEGFLYVFGGWQPPLSFYSTVSLAQINPDGSLGPWATTTSMPQARQHLSVHFSNGRVYIVGGITDGNQLLDSAFSAPVNSDGTLGDWRPEASLPHPLWQHASALVNGELFLFGGIGQYSGGPVTSVYRGVIDPGDGAIRNWTTAGSMPTANVVMPGAVYSEASENLYLIGGWNLVGNAQNSSREVWRASLAAEPLGILLSWTASGMKITDLINHRTNTVPDLPSAEVPLAETPSWFSNGQLILFMGGVADNGQIYVVRPDGSDLRRITDGSGNWQWPDSPDHSAWIVAYQVGGDVFTMPSDGSSITNLGFQLAHTRVSRDGRYIVGSNWAVGGGETNTDVFVYDFVTGTLTNATAHLRQGNDRFTHVDISPDNAKLAVSHTDLTLGRTDIWIINLDGSDPLNITAAWPWGAGTPSWSPDGRYIFCVGNEAGNYDMWAMRPDGSGRVNLTQSPEDDYGPADLLLVAPTITAQPISQTVSGGGTVCFTVEVTGTRPFTYQWQYNGADVPGANSATLCLTGTPERVGTYRVNVTSDAGKVTSAEAVLNLFGITREVPVLRIDGFVGRTYRIEYRNALDASSSWQTLKTITLMETPDWTMDKSAVGQPKRFYQAILMP